MSQDVPEAGCTGGRMYMRQDVQEAYVQEARCTGGMMYMRQDVHEAGCT